MISKRIILSALLISLCFICRAQTVSHINVVIADSKASVASVEFVYNNIAYCIGINGNFIRRYDGQNNTSVTYYDEFDGQGRNIGKLKTIDNTSVTYYDEFDGQDRVIGKLKTIGNINFTYYSEFDGFDNIGKLKSVGDTRITYYDTFDGRDIGRLKSIGNTHITYYTEFDGFDNIGKLKSIGNATITYFDRFDTSQPTGQIKSINGNEPYLNVLTM